MTTISGVRVLRQGPVTLFQAEFAGQEVLLKRLAHTTPWTDRGSAFFGGHGIAPPFVPLLLHEAEAWRRVDPGRVVLAEVTTDATWLMLRRQPGAAPSGKEDPESFLVGLLSALASLHAADILHRDVTPANLLVHEGRVSLIDLDVARVAGLGPVGSVGSRRFRAPETWAGEGDGRMDLYSAAATMRSVFGEGLPTHLRPLVDACMAESVSDRPRSAREALGTLGVDAPEPALSPPSFWARAWWSGEWADSLLLCGQPWDIVRHADRIGLEVPGLAAAASRLLPAALRMGREAWLSLGAVCWALHAATGDARYGAQADEARAYARAPWHPADRALNVLLLSTTAPADRISALCDLGLATLALQGAVAGRHPSHVTRAAWELGDVCRVDAALRMARGDALAVAVTASRVLLEAPERAANDIVRAALRSDVLEAVRRMLHLGNIPAAEALARSLPAPPEAWIPVHVSTGSLERAWEAARACAAAAAWSGTVAVLVATDPASSEAGRHAAVEILRESLPAPLAYSDGADALGALGQQPAVPEQWGRVVVALTGISRMDLFGTALGLAAATAGPAPWRLLIGMLGADPAASVVAEAVYQRAMSFFDGDPHLMVLGATLALRREDWGLAESRITECLASAPENPWGWLLRAATARDRAAARCALAAADAFGGPRELVRLLGAPLLAK